MRPTQSLTGGLAETPEPYAPALVCSGLRSVVGVEHNSWLVISECLLSQGMKVTLRQAVRMRRVLLIREQWKKDP